jgi:hypothetical protein
MESIEIEAAKVPKMHEYIEKCMQELSATEVSEFAKQRRQYYSASQIRQSYLTKLKELEEATQQELKTKEKNNVIFFIVVLITGLASSYLNWLDASEKAVLGVGFAAYFVVTHIASHLDAHNYANKRDGYQKQVEYYKHEMSCAGGGYVEYEDEFYSKQHDDDKELRKVIRNLYFASVEIAILHGLKTTVPTVRF